MTIYPSSIEEYKCKAYYHGCVGGAGHYLFDRNLRQIWRSQIETGIPWPFLDGALAPYYPDCTFNDVTDSQGHIRAFCSRRYPYADRPEDRQRCDAIEGLTKFHNKRDATGAYWTALAFWDRSVDKRGGCNSVFILEGSYNFEQALTLARQIFPKIFERFEFEIKEAK